jgi:hypothetical protein
VCPLNSDFSSESSSPVISESISISRAPLRSRNSTARRVSFRSPHEYDVFIIPATRDSDDYDSSDGEPPRIWTNEGLGQRGSIMLQPIPGRFAVLGRNPERKSCI